MLFLSAVYYIIIHCSVTTSRFWQSTAAYTIATECACGDASVLPPSGHWCYQWPDNLVKPHVILLLIAPEGVRDQRLGARQEVITAEEGQLRKDRLFRERYIVNIYTIERHTCFYFYVLIHW